MHAEPAVLDLVGLVYEAAGDRSLWPTPKIFPELGITLNTAKTHAKRIFAKTGARGHADFCPVGSFGAGGLERNDKTSPDRVMPEG